MFSYYFRLFRAVNPTVDPKYFLTDKDASQINAIESVFSSTKVILCWWHLIEAWKKKFPPARNRELWKRLYQLLYETNEDKFFTKWNTLKDVATAYDNDRRKNVQTCALCLTSKTDGVNYLADN